MDLASWCDAVLGNDVSSDEPEAECAQSGITPVEVVAVGPDATLHGPEAEVPVHGGVELVEDAGDAREGEPVDVFYDVEELWQPHLDDPLNPVREIVGEEQLRDVIGASICTGMSAEQFAYRKNRLKARMAFGCDSKESAFNFVDENQETKPEHWFVDVMELDEKAEPAEGDENGGTTIQGRCACHGMSMCALTIAKLWIDQLVAGISCRPFSTSRMTRMTMGSEAHSDFMLLPAFIRMLQRLQPKGALLENVFGMSLPESTDDPVSPLMKVVEWMRNDGLPYGVRIFVVCGSTFLRWRRRRIYMSLIHNDHGGEDACRKQELIVKAFYAS